MVVMIFVFIIIIINSVADLSVAFYWLSTIVKVILGPGLFIICNDYLASLVACYVVYNPGMMRWCGKNFTTSAFLSPLFWCIAGIAHVVFHFRLNVPSRYSMDSPSFMLLRFFVY